MLLVDVEHDVEVGQRLRSRANDMNVSSVVGEARDGYLHKIPGLTDSSILEDVHLTHIE